MSSSRRSSLSPSLVRSLIIKRSLSLSRARVVSLSHRRLHGENLAGALPHDLVHLAVGAAAQGLALRLSGGGIGR